MWNMDNFTVNILILHRLKDKYLPYKVDTLWNVRWMTDQAPLSQAEKAKIEKLRVYTSQHINRLSHDRWDAESISTNSGKSNYNQDPESQDDKVSTGRSDDIKSIKPIINGEQKEEEDPNEDNNNSKILIVINEDEKKQNQNEDDPELDVIYDDLFENDGTGDRVNNTVSNGDNNDTLRSEAGTEIELQNSQRL